jgi:hypothetical protein
MSQSSSNSGSFKLQPIFEVPPYDSGFWPNSPLPGAPFETTGSDGDFEILNCGPSNATLPTVSSSSHGPSHYKRGKIEVWDFIRDQDLNYHLGNAIKYICRAGHKDSKVDDLKKAIHYLQNELEHSQP